MRHNALILSAVLLAALAAPAAAQVYKCAGPDGQTIYSDAPCASGRAMDPAQLRGNSLEATRAPVTAPPIPGTGTGPGPGPGPGPGSAPAVAAPRAACLSDNDIRNLEVSASSIALSPVERQLQQEDVGRAKACEPLMTEREKNALRRKLEDRELKRRAVAERIAACEALAQAPQRAASSSTAFCTAR